MFEGLASQLITTETLRKNYPGNFDIDAFTAPCVTPGVRYHRTRSHSVLGRARCVCTGSCRFFRTRGYTYALTRVNASARLRKTRRPRSQTRRILGNGRESCPSGTFRCFGGPRANKPALDKPSRMASAVNATWRHFHLALRISDKHSHQSQIHTSRAMPKVCAEFG